MMKQQFKVFCLLRPITTFSLSLTTEYTMYIIHLVMLFTHPPIIHRSTWSDLQPVVPSLGFYCTTAILDLSNLEIYNFILNMIAIAIINIYCLLSNPPEIYKCGLNSRHASSCIRVISQSFRF